MDASLTAKAELLASEMALQATSVQDINGMFRTMMKSVLERMLDTEMDVHLGRRGVSTAAAESLSVEETSEVQPKPANRRNGRSRKSVQGDMGEITLATPRDRNGTFEPQLLPKYQRRLPGFDEKILSLYAKGMTTRDIQDVIRDLYEVEVSPTLISEITADLDAEVTAWRQRRLESVYPIVFFDGITVHVRAETGRVSRHTMYVALGVNMQGKKELLGLWLNETEGAKFWLSCLTDLQSRGLENILITCMDGLVGFPEAVHAAYPKARVQLCIVHMVRAALRYVTSSDSKAVVADLKKIYQAPTAAEAEVALQEFSEVWGKDYPTIAKQWRAKWADWVTIFDFPPAIRKAIYTTNAIESVNSVIRKYTRNRKQYPNAESALKMIFLAINEASKRWTLPIRSWKPALNYFAIVFEDIIPADFRSN